MLSPVRREMRFVNVPGTISGEAPGQHVPTYGRSALTTPRFGAFGSPTVSTRSRVVSFGADGAPAGPEALSQIQRRAYQNSIDALSPIVSAARSLADYTTRKVIDSAACSAWFEYTGKSDALCSRMTKEAIDIERECEGLTYQVRDTTPASYRDPANLERWIKGVGAQCEALTARAKKVLDTASWSFVEEIRQQFLASVENALRAVLQFQEDLIAAGVKGIGKGIGPVGILLIVVGGFFLVRNVATLAARG